LPFISTVIFYRHTIFTYTFIIRCFPSMTHSSPKLEAACSS
jgi:hypothetical protein